MATIHSITFSTANWKPFEFWKFQMTWHNEKYKEILSITKFDDPPDFVADLSDVEKIRQQTQEAINAFQGEISEIQQEMIDHVPMLRQIIKLPNLDHGHGHIYIGTFTIPFQDFSYVIKVECPEIRTTGLRESAALDDLFNRDQIKLSDIEGKIRTNEIPTEIRQLVSRTTDDPKFDSQFPSHPLTRLRKHMITTRNSMELDGSLKQAKPFKK